MNSNDFNRLKETVEKYKNILFNKRYVCICDLMSLSIIQKQPNVEISEEPYFTSVGGYGFNNGVVRTETNNDKELLEMSLGRNRDLVGYEYMQHIGSSTGDHRSLTIVNMAEIVAGYGRYDLVNFTDGHDIAFSVEKYIESVNSYSKVDLHYHKPPEEDMIALSNLLNAVNRYLEKSPNKKPTSTRKRVQFGESSYIGIQKQTQEIFHDPRGSVNLSGYKV